MVAMENPSFRRGTQSVLVVEDEMVSRTALAMLLKASGYAPVTAGSAEEALQMLVDTPMPAIALIDLDLPGMNGADLISELRSRGIVTAMLITAATREKVEAVTRGTIPHMRKPVDFRQLLTVLSEQ